MPLRKLGNRVKAGIDPGKPGKKPTQSSSTYFNLNSNLRNLPLSELPQGLLPEQSVRKNLSPVSSRTRSRGLSSKSSSARKRWGKVRTVLIFVTCNKKPDKQDESNKQLTN